MKILLAAIFAIFSAGIMISQDFNTTYLSLISDLENVNTPGYIGLATDGSDILKVDFATQGILVATEFKLAFAIRGMGFFRARDPLTGRTYLTRTGLFHPNKEGLLSLPNGFILVPEIAIGDGQVLNTSTINNEYTITTNENGAERVIRGKFSLYTPSLDSALQNKAGQYFLFDDISEVPLPEVVSGYFETSTVNPYYILRIMKLTILTAEYQKQVERAKWEEQIRIIDAILKNGIFFSDVERNGTGSGHKTGASSELSQAEQDFIFDLQKLEKGNGKSYTTDEWDEIITALKKNALPPKK